MKKTNIYYPLVPFEDSEGYWGFKDSITKKIHIEPVYEYANEFEKGYACVIFKGKYGVIDKDNNFIIPPIYDYLGDLYDGAFEVYDEKDNRFVIDITGSVFLKSKESDGLYGYVDYDENVVIPFQYENAADFSEGLAAVKKNGKWGYINKKGEVVIPFRWGHADLFSEGFAAVKRISYYKEKWSESKHKMVREYFYKDNIDDVPDDVETWKNREMAIGYINKKGEILEPHLPDEEVFLTFAEPFSEGRACINCYHSEWYNEHDRAFYIDTEGNIVFEVEDVNSGIHYHPFSCGRAAVSAYLRGWGYIDRDGKLVIPYQYQEIVGFDEMEFNNGYAIVKRNNLYGCIDVDGNEIVPCIYKEYDTDVVTFIKNHLESLKSD